MADDGKSVETAYQFLNVQADKLHIMEARNRLRTQGYHIATIDSATIRFATDYLSSRLDTMSLDDAASLLKYRGFPYPLLYQAYIYVQNEISEQTRQAEQRAQEKSNTNRTGTDTPPKEPTHQAPLNHYQVLQVDPRAEPEVIVGAYKRLAVKYHPDKNPSLEATQRMRQINAAYEVLSSPEKRAVYDQEQEYTTTREQHRSATSTSYSSPPNPKTQSTTTAAVTPTASPQPSNAPFVLLGVGVLLFIVMLVTQAWCLFIVALVPLIWGIIGIMRTPRYY